MYMGAFMFVRFGENGHLDLCCFVPVLHVVCMHLTKAKTVDYDPRDVTLVNIGLHKNENYAVRQSYTSKMFNGIKAVPYRNNRHFLAEEL